MTVHLILIFRCYSSFSTNSRIWRNALLWRVFLDLMGSGPPAPGPIQPSEIAVLAFTERFRAAEDTFHVVRRRERVFSPQIG